MKWKFYCEGSNIQNVCKTNLKGKAQRSKSIGKNTTGHEKIRIIKIFESKRNLSIPHGFTVRQFHKQHIFPNSFQLTLRHCRQY
jgi:hypothetical protein